MADQSKPVTGYPAAQPYYGATPSGNPSSANSYPAPPPYYANPYYQPPPPPPPQPYYNSATYGSSLIRRAFAIAIAVIIIFGLVSLIFWLVLRPKVPEYTVQSASISQFNLSDSKLTANWNVTLNSFNGNKKMGIYYDEIRVSLYYGSELLSQTGLPPFYQETKNSTVLIARFASDGDFVGDEVGKKMSAQKGNGNVEFNVRLAAWVRFNTGGWRTRRHVLIVLCDHVNIGFNSSSSVVGNLTRDFVPCRVDV
ncbi:NDR1/HIN1-like protein 10 [Amborella trichopoda]|uniref:Late embryogenesis abundant protein LEA-2 subgroup domain-containing protein n=1 Tax=Amborella trichopoda TaxID=13333 RepID=U5D404_AMBTC|nr:NDR1/HIN1-like protein 10 [Amborella trichopoda]ERN16142.1 hypothetical protein AMTR_s00030p00210920 [Amborella trichopoda]|eukprot:XP_006854675.1 NDR1/HIN1-like protein 10 [Amborella trichopoda]